MFWALLLNKICKTSSSGHNQSVTLKYRCLAQIANCLLSVVLFGKWELRKTKLNYKNNIFRISTYLPWIQQQLNNRDGRRHNWNCLVHLFNWTIENSSEWTVKVNESMLHLIKRICSVKVKSELWVFWSNKSNAKSSTNLKSSDKISDWN